MSEDLKKATELDKVICPKCDPLSEKKWILRTKLQEHIKTNHIDWGNYNDE